ncbi:replication initiation protein [Paraburkholderia sp. A3RO-2L]|uniref:replication initiation protein n=1 Tax=Paraburkholderia sp. A3RO-2L TaxID=3028376 RepID=UPI003DA8AEA5
MSKNTTLAISSNLPQEVRKHISAVHVAGDLTGTERKLINVLLLNAYEDLTTKNVFSLPVAVMCEMIGWGESKNISHLKDSLRRITTTSVEFDVLYDSSRDKKRQKWAISAPVSAATIADGICTYEYSSVMRQALANPEVYAVINLNVQKEFTGAYSLALYENCVRFRGTKSTGFISVDLWKKLLGVGVDRQGNPVATSAYDQFKHFNNQVIQKAVKEINAVSDIYITPEYQRAGRKVVAIKFLVERNAQGTLTLAEPDQDAVRESEAYKLLRGIGVSDRLAVDWVSTDPERALRTAKITSDRMDRKLIKASAVGYASTLFKGDGELSLPVAADEQDKATPDNAKDQAKVEVDLKLQQAKKTDAAIAALTEDETDALIAEFIEEQGAKTFDSERGKFRDIAEQVAFRTFTRQHAVKIIESRVVG